MFINRVGKKKESTIQSNVIVEGPKFNKISRALKIQVKKMAFQCDYQASRPTNATVSKFSKAGHL